MALTPSTMLPLGTPAPDFALLDTVGGDTLRFADVAGDKGTVVMFICNHCPYVKHLEHDFGPLARSYMARGIGFVAISANDAQTYPQDGPEAMRDNARRLDWPFPYLYDDSQDTARAYQAACTPDFFVFDAQGECAYRGQYDASRPGNEHPVTGADLRAALDALLRGEAPGTGQTPSVGCNIKWKDA